MQKQQERNLPSPAIDYVKPSVKWLLKHSTHTQLDSFLKSTSTMYSSLRFDIIGTQHGLFDGYCFAVLFGLEAGMNLLPTITR
ncbi:hypothetical protein [Pseudoalteromonas piscicida]|uniref:hypothetical protein n=1 Tax=Pseudoalteromonas piscicida TaxID=43662 RepID=UPI0027E4EF02|nr:hypothetical protein [Pseudoalteromonas piscicida]WMO16798.1 hypothetical protein NI376_21480 [Pseudoalteromonas piscicida]